MALNELFLCPFYPLAPIGLPLFVYKWHPTLSGSKKSCNPSPSQPRFSFDNTFPDKSKKIDQNGHGQSLEKAFNAIVFNHGP